MVNVNHVVDLKNKPDFIEQYVRLRNRYCDLLVTNPVNVMETRKWLKQDDIEIRGIVNNDLLIGVVILYLSRCGEVAFFAMSKLSGLGSTLLSIIEVVAKERGLQEIWAWVLSNNVIAQRVFQKNGYKKEEMLTKEHNGQLMTGFVFKKILL